jgi:Uma2 family endonuclease
MLIRNSISRQDYENKIAEAEQQDKRFDIINGEIVEIMPTFTHGELTLTIASLIRQFNRIHRLGRVSVEARYRPLDEGYDDLIPDVSFIRDATRIVEQGPILGMPDLAIEIQSPDQSEKFLLEKGLLYLRLGVEMVWLVYYKKRLIEVLTQNERFLLTENDLLEGGTVLPNFSVFVREIFE